MKKRWIYTFVTGVLTVVMLAGCGSSNVVKIGHQPTSEQTIMAQMLKQVIEGNSDIKVDLVGGLGATPVVLKAMENNDIQISAIRYVGTDLTSSLGLKEFSKDPQEAFDLVKKGVAEKFDQEWFPSYGFDNTYVFTVRKEIADKYQLKKISDLAKVARELHLGTDASWLERPNDGYEAFKQEYGFDFGKKTPMDIGLVYKAVANGEVDIVLAYSTDSRLKEFNLVTLEDDKHFFPPYGASAVVRNDTLKQYPQLTELINKLSNKIDTPTMTALNYQADVEKHDPEEIARTFLQEQGLIQK
ncbi:osmoprotectant ABC transporter substrate-binding protein [Brevibacillus centrosporus]|uniref:Osmoprotectant transport system substrate-binding protein n=1 Tax=Brevibacillus centrosporus TaxID=54910 RepID=A0A1I3ZK10_9BACL|nr:osmoprotectant ABC transporter substrate-binding protein [Brevibacillus centrosporus]SFK43889.1 osmoprotectant transport system substrate-binding protein [Brevibacillus centrosporus]